MCFNALVYNLIFVHSDRVNVVHRKRTYRILLSTMISFRLHRIFIKPVKYVGLVELYTENALARLLHLNCVRVHRRKSSRKTMLR